MVEVANHKRQPTIPANRGQEDTLSSAPMAPILDLVHVVVGPLVRGTHK